MLKELQGERIYLRAIEEEDVPYRVKWLNDPKFIHYIYMNYPVSELSTRQWLQKVNLDENRKDFIICTNENNKPIGFAGFINIDYKNSKAELYIGIGETDYWGKGLGKEAINLQINFGFMVMGLNRIYTYNWVDNTRVIEMNKNFGFIVEGTLRKNVYLHGEYRDHVVMGLLKEDYLKLDI